MPDIAYINGEFVPLQEACVSLNDRAYYFADAVYEVCTTFGGRLFIFDSHMDRLENSLRGVKIEYRVDRPYLAGLMEEGMRRAGYAESLVYLQISRGSGLRDKRFPAGPERNLVLTVREKRPIPPERFRQGIRLILVPDERWAHCNYKTVMLLPNVLAHQAALDEGKDDALFFHPEGGMIYEATSANIFLVHGGRLATPPEGPKILSGTVRKYLIDLARRNGLEVDEHPINRTDLGNADEAFLTGTTTEVLGIVEADGAQLGDGHPGPITRRLHGIFRESVGTAPVEYGE
jgi:D-alanine transaminase